MIKYVLPALLVFAANPAHASPVGIWRTADGAANIQIKRCGRNLCGETGGKTVFPGMRPISDGLWSGVIYDPRHGDKYDGQISLVDKNSLKVHGCLPGGGLCGDQTWTRTK
jgi:uncharacterized protein (DUF2147 family)